MKNQSLIEEWMSRAKSDFALASKGKFSKDVRYDSLCFHAQQSAEKSIKAILVFYSITFPKTHSIEYLLKILKENKITVPTIIEKTQILTDYAVNSRYPDEFSPEEQIDKKEYKEAVLLAKKTFDWAKSIIKKKQDKLF